jgi:hypothetical protein
MSLIPKATGGHEPISYRGALLSTLLHATVYVFIHNFLNVLVQVVNEIGLQKRITVAAMPSNGLGNVMCLPSCYHTTDSD